MVYFEESFMNVLLLGNSDSVFIRDFCTQVLHTEKINAAILTPALSVNYGKNYSSNAIREVSWPFSFLMSIQEKASVLLFRVMEKRKLEKKFWNNTRERYCEFNKELERYM